MPPIEAGKPAHRVSRSLYQLMTDTTADRWDVRNISLADVFRTWPNEFVVGVLLEDVAGPAGYAADGEDGCVEVERNSHHVVSRGGEEVDVWIETLLAHDYFFNLARHLIPL